MDSKTTTEQQAAADAAAHETAARLNKAEQDRAEREKAADAAVQRVDARLDKAEQGRVEREKAAADADSRAKERQIAAKAAQDERDKLTAEKAAAEKDKRDRHGEMEANWPGEPADPGLAYRLPTMGAPASDAEMDQREKAVAGTAEHAKADAEREQNRLHEEKNAADVAHERMRVWRLRPKNRNAPPFFFTGTMQTYVVEANSAEHARKMAAGDSRDHFAAWRDETQTECVELPCGEPGVVARDLGT